MSKRKLAEPRLRVKRETQWFLENVFGDALDQGLHVLVWTLPDKVSRFFKTSDSAAAYGIRKAATSDVYVGVGFHREPSPQGRGTEADVAGIVCLWADIDVAGPCHQKKNLPPNLAAARALLDKMPLSPSITVQSGHGLQAFWLFREPWRFDSEDERARAKSVATGWINKIRAAARRRGWDVDAVGDLTRVLRMPGTVNRKAKPIQVRIIEPRSLADDLPRYNPSEFEPFLADEDPIHDAAVSVGVGSLVLRADAEPPKEKIRALVNGDPKCRQSWERNRPDLQDQSPSAYDLSLAMHAAKADWTDQEIADLIIAHRRRCGEDVSKALRQDYIVRTVKKARVAAQAASKESGLSAHRSLLSLDSAGLDDQDRWPDPPAEDAFSGLAGRVVRAIEPHTEGDPVALLLQFLVIFGNIIGRSAHFVADGTVHSLNLFVVLVGITSKSRKGTSLAHILNLYGRVEPVWRKNCVPSGLSSGEGLIWAVRDPITKRDPIKKDSRWTGEYQDVEVDPGVGDKRLLVVEPEFAATLRVLGRDGNTLSPLIRQAWDTGDLQTLTKNSPAKATGAHISSIGHITRDELLRYLSDTEAANGFGNRFLWGCVHRTKCLPEGGNIRKDDFDGFVQSLGRAVKFAREVKRLRLTNKARDLWYEVYPVLSEGVPGLLGAVTSRAEAQVIRLACAYALLDCSKDIHEVHLKAALAVWRFCENSARFVFGASLGDPLADEILRVLRDRPDGMTRTEIRDLFQHHRTREQIGRALSLLADRQLVRPVRGETAGRPTERWLAVMSGDKSDKSALR